MFLGLLVIAVVGVLGLVGSMMPMESYGSKLEHYIVSNNPRDAMDVDRLAKEYHEKESRSFL